MINYMYDRENFLEQVLDYAWQFIIPKKRSLAERKVTRAMQNGLELSVLEGLALESEI